MYYPILFAIYGLCKRSIEKYRNEIDHLDRLTFILFAVVSSVIEISETHGDCNAEYIWSELEHMAKEGGLTAVAEKIKSGRTYSISEIAPQDFGSGMNYLGQHVATALHKHIHDLPIQQRKPEMFLRALETVMANLINQKFADCDRHAIIDSFCEHLHMALDAQGTPTNARGDKVSDLKLPKSEPVKPKIDSKPKIKNQQSIIRDIVIKINQRALDALSHGGPVALMGLLPSFIHDLDKIMHHENKDEIDDLCNEYEGFYQLMSVVEALAEDISSGKIKVT